MLCRKAFIVLSSILNMGKLLAAQAAGAEPGWPTPRPSPVPATGDTHLVPGKFGP